MGNVVRTRTSGDCVSKLEPLSSWDRWQRRTLTLNSTCIEPSQHSGSSECVWKLGSKGKKIFVDCVHRLMEAYQLSTPSWRKKERDQTGASSVDHSMMQI